MGYTGGTSDNPTYRSVCEQPNAEGHTEAIRIVFDPSELRFEELMRRFFAEATPNIRRMQYRSAVWAQSPAQMDVAARIATECGMAAGVPVLATAPWYDAEPEHQKYYEKMAAPRVCGRRLPSAL